MKKLLAILGLTIVATAANTHASPQTVRVKVEGTVRFEKSYTMTCMAIGCPPSQPYYYVVLQDARSEDGKFAFRELSVEQLATKPGENNKPEAIEFKGQKIHEKDVVTLDLDLTSYTSANITLGGQVYAVEKK